MNVIVPPSNVRLDDIGSCGSRAMVVVPKSARRALGGVLFVVKMLATGGLDDDRHPRWTQLLSKFNGRIFTLEHGDTSYL
jgi:hypothetical protein